MTCRDSLIFGEIPSLRFTDSEPQVPFDFFFVPFQRHCRHSTPVVSCHPGFLFKRVSTSIYNFGWNSIGCLSRQSKGSAREGLMFDTNIIGGELVPSASISIAGRVHILVRRPRAVEVSARLIIDPSIFDDCATSLEF